MNSGALSTSPPPSPSPARGEEREQLTRSLGALGTRLRAKGLVPSSFVESHEKLFGTRLPAETWLPVDLLSVLLMSCGRWSVSRCALCACLLQCLPEETMENFTMACSLGLSKYVFKLGERWRGGKVGGGSEEGEGEGAGSEEGDGGEREEVKGGGKVGGGSEEGDGGEREEVKRGERECVTGEGEEESDLLESGLFLLAVYLTIALSIGMH